MKFKSQAYHWLYSVDSLICEMRIMSLLECLYLILCMCHILLRVLYSWLHESGQLEILFTMLVLLYHGSDNWFIFANSTEAGRYWKKKKTLLNEMNTYLCVLEQRSHENSSALFSSRKKNVHHQDAVLKITRILAGWQNVNQSTLSPWRKMSGNNKGLL